MEWDGRLVVLLAALGIRWEWRPSTGSGCAGNGNGVGRWIRVWVDSVRDEVLEDAVGLLAGLRWRDEEGRGLQLELPGILRHPSTSSGCVEDAARDDADGAGG